MSDTGRRSTPSSSRGGLKRPVDPADYSGAGCDTGTVTRTAQKVVVPVTTGY